jgi:NADPH:quinone reductase-like Zn-dependent oxidoreductase
VTADYLLRDLGRVKPGARWLVHAAAGGLGLLLCSWAKRLGARVVGTVSNEDKARLAREFGCEYVIVTKDYCFADAVKQHFGDGADVIIDGLGDAAREENFKALASCGHWISLGQVSGALQPIDPNLLVSKSATFSRPVAFAYVPTKASLGERAQRVWDGLSDGSIRRPPIERYSLEAASRAHEWLESRHSTGTIVLLA